MRYVIIGGSAAAIGCIEGIRSVDKTGEIILITRETEWNYSRPLISYLLEGKTTRDKMWCRPDSFFTRNGVTVKAGVLATALDAGDRTVRLSTGERLVYDRLLAATGSRPFVPPIPGLETVERTFCFQTLSDASALAEALRPESRVLILGAGLTGVKCAEGIRGLCAQIAIADLAPRVLPAVLDDTGAAMVQARMEEKGVRFYLNDSAAAFRGNTARLQSGTELEFDVLVTAVGVRPNTQLVADAGGAVDRGILVDGRCATTLPDVYAAGDCAQGYDAVSGPCGPTPCCRARRRASTWRAAAPITRRALPSTLRACSACTWLRRAVMRARASRCRGTAATNALSRQTAFSRALSWWGMYPAPVFIQTSSARKSRCRRSTLT